MPNNNSVRDDLAESLEFPAKITKRRVYEQRPAVPISVPGYYAMSRMGTAVAGPFDTPSQANKAMIAQKGAFIQYQSANPDRPVQSKERGLVQVRRIGTRKQAAGKDLKGQDLSGQDFSGALLRGANLGNADLTGANLWRAQLNGANLIGADLTNANLTEAYLTGAILIVANLSGADLSGAWLSRANLTMAILTGTRGDADTRLPPGYKVDNGYVVREGTTASRKKASVDWGKPYANGEAGWGRPAYTTDTGEDVWMYRKRQTVRFYNAAGEQVGPEQSNVAPALAYADAQGWVQSPYVNDGGGNCNFGVEQLGDLASAVAHRPDRNGPEYCDVCDSPDAPFTIAGQKHLCWDCHDDYENGTPLNFPGGGGRRLNPSRLVNARRKTAGWEPAGDDDWVDGSDEGTGQIYELKGAKGWVFSRNGEWAWGISGPLDGDGEYTDEAYDFVSGTAATEEGAKRQVEYYDSLPAYDSTRKTAGWNGSGFGVPIAYYVEGDDEPLCPGDAFKQFGADVDGWIPDETPDGRFTINPVFANEEWYDIDVPGTQNLVCKDCGGVIDTYEGYDDGLEVESYKKTAMADPAALGVSVGSIFYSSWGYDQTNIDFYQVTRMTGASVEVRRIGQRIVEDLGSSVKVVADPDNFIGSPQMRRIRDAGGTPGFTLTSYSGAFLWDGSPKYQTGAGYGH